MRTHLSVRSPKEVIPPLKFIPGYENDEYDDAEDRDELLDKVGTINGLNLPEVDNRE